MCGVRYVENSAFPKDVLILLDRSGSMKGVRLEIARSTVEKILGTLTDDDHFNVIAVTGLRLPFINLVVKDIHVCVVFDRVAH